jgi:dipeptidyl aminopeptidase/acylaminoacyl peptidase
VLNAPVTPIANLSPSRDVVLMVTPVLYPPIADLARPMLRLAGVRIDPANNAEHNAPRYTGFVLKRIQDGRELKVTIPIDPYLSAPVWSPDGRRFAFTNTTRNAVELWIGVADTGSAHKVPGVQLNAALGAPFRWMPDGRSLLCLTVPAGRGVPPTPPSVPTGPHVEESFGNAAPQPTFEDLLQSAFDERRFDYYATSQLERVDIEAGRITRVGRPAIFRSVQPAPNGNAILVERVHRPYSYLVPYEDFACAVEVWDQAGQRLYRVADLPLHENTPLGGVPVGPRNAEWQPTSPTTLIWVEALDGGNPHRKAPFRDRVMWIDLASGGRRKGGDGPHASELLKTEQRFSGLFWGERSDLAIFSDFDRDTQRIRTFFWNPKSSTTPPRLVWDRSVQERYKEPGSPLLRPNRFGREVIVQSGDSIFLAGPGATPQGDRPFLDRFDCRTLTATRLFRCDEHSYEFVTDLLTPDASRFLTRHEAPDAPPNYWIRTLAGASTPFTSFPDPTPQLAGIRKQLVTYKRPDGVGLSMTLYLPPGYTAGERRPAVMWAYPFEYTSAALASQVTGSPNHFTTIRGTSELFFLLAGYVVLDNASMPVVGDPQTMNDTYVEQTVADAKAAIDRAAELGYIDPNRVGVGGHSYGAFMTANLLAHSDLFRAGIARSGAYNRTLTPFTFQSERRTLWEAPDTYLKMSPFMYADKIKAPILLIHGEADNNTGTFPIQSERMYRAIKGNGGSVRYVTLPDEAHGYAARESIEHVLWEMLRWFDRYVKPASGTPTPSGS